MPMTRTPTQKTTTKRPMTKLALKRRPMTGMRTRMTTMTKIMKKKNLKKMKTCLSTQTNWTTC
eukprot:scaffold300545_cov35-Attheya_sp.AAC.1